MGSNIATLFGYQAKQVKQMSLCPGQVARGKVKW